MAEGGLAVRQGRNALLELCEDRPVDVLTIIPVLGCLLGRRLTGVIGNCSAGALGLALQSTRVSCRGI